MWEAPLMLSVLPGIWKKTARLQGRCPLVNLSLKKTEETGIILLYQPVNPKWMAEL